MATATPPTAVFEKLQSDIQLDIDVSKCFDVIALTPHLVLAVSMLYMMSSDGTIEDEESSQLQASLGGHETLVQLALRYVQVVPVDQFLQKAPEALSAQDKLCILSNVCDSMLSDGRSEPGELALFDRFVGAFGLSAAAFDAYFKTIALKNDKSILGQYEALDMSLSRVTPHLALAASLLYMMTSDGSIGAEEIGLLEGVIGEFEGLQQVALNYVRVVKRAEFLQVAAPLLSHQQKLYILINVCDSMLSDGSVASLEDKLFVSMLAAFGFTEKAFDPYYQVIETKNIKPFDVSKFKLSKQHTRWMTSEAPVGEVFDKILTDTQLEPTVTSPTTPNGATASVTASAIQGSMGSVIHRTMQDNIASVNQDFGGQENVVKVGLNATDQLNVQKIAQASDVANLQKVTASQSEANMQTLMAEEAQRDNRQLLAGETEVDNRQAVGSEAFQENKQSIDADLYATYGVPSTADCLIDNVQNAFVARVSPNIQNISQEATSANQALLEGQGDQADKVDMLTPQVRVQHLFEDIDTLHRKLDDFEEKNKEILAAAKKARKESQRREAQAQAQAQALYRQSVEESVEMPNFQTLQSDAPSINLQTVAIERLQIHDAKVSTSFETSFVRWVDPAQQPYEANGLSKAGSDVYESPSWQAHGAVASRRSTLRNNSAKHQTRSHADAVVSWRVYVKTTVTFVILSCWASGISAIDSVRTKRFVGVLERPPVVMLNQVPMQARE